MPFDRLIRPCSCCGTMEHVHSSCLNMWREVNETPNASSGCMQCGQAYRIRKTAASEWLAKKEFAQVGAAVVMVSAIGSFAFMSFLLPTSFFIDAFYEFAELRRADADWSPVVKHVVFGSACVGLIAFALHLFEVIAFLRDHGTMESFFGVLLALTANGQRGIRVFCATGLATAVVFAFRNVQRVARKFAHTYGERVLDVDEEA